MKLPRQFLALAIALVPVLTPAAPTVLPVTWEQWGPTGFDVTAASFRGAIYALGNDGGGSEGKLWTSTDSGRTWKSESSYSGKLTGIVSFWVDREEVMFLSATTSASSATHLLRRDKDGESVVLDSLEPNFWTSQIVQAGNALLLRTRTALMRSVDGGRTWKAIEPAILKRASYGLLEPAFITGSGKRLIAMVAQQTALYSSSDSGNSWKSLSENFKAPDIPNRGTVDASGETMFFPHYNGAPIRLRFQGDSWLQDTLETGWPLDSMGLATKARSILRFKDTVWSTAGKNLLFWKPSESSWQLVKLDMPNHGDQVILDTAMGELWLFGTQWLAKRDAGGKVSVVTPPDPAYATPKIALGWHQGALFLCGWTGCAISRDSGKAWEAANRGLEGTYVGELKSTSLGMMAATFDFGLRLWNGTFWQDAGMHGIDRDSLTGRYGQIGSLTSVADTLAFSWAWKDGIWMRKGKQAGWSLIEHGDGGPIAWAEGAYWTWKSTDSLETSKSGSVWKSLRAPFSGTLHGVDGQAVITQFWGKHIARLQGNNFRVDTLEEPISQLGSFVASHPSGVMAKTSGGVFLVTDSEIYKMPFPTESASNWISAMLRVGNRLFVTHSSGMLTTTLPSRIQVGLNPRDRHSWRIGNLSRGVALDLAKSARVEFSWYDLSGARRGGIDQVMEAGKHALVVPTNYRGTKIVRVSVDGVLSESRVLVMP